MCSILILKLNKKYKRYAVYFDEILCMTSGSNYLYYVTRT